MPRILKVCFVLGVCVVAKPAAAQEPNAEPEPMNLESDQTGNGPAATQESADKSTSAKPTAKSNTKDQQAGPVSNRTAPSAGHPGREAHRKKPECLGDVCNRVLPSALRHGL